MAQPEWPGQDTDLDQIDTDWSIVHEPYRLVMRYAEPIQMYLQALIKNKHDAEDVGQDFFLWISEHGLPRARQERGRFRDYLKKIVRNRALDFQRRQKASAKRDARAAEPSATKGPLIPDQEWVGHWRRCLLKQTWRRLARHQRQTPDNFCYSVLRMHVAHPGGDSKTLAEKASKDVGKAMSAPAFRKQVSRARRLFAQFLIKEIAQTLDDPKPDAVEEELVDLGLIGYVRGCVSFA